MTPATQRARLTPAQVAALRWFAEHGEVALFDASAPSRITRQRLENAGLIETCGKQASGGVFAFTKFRISAAGRQAIGEQA